MPHSILDGPQPDVGVHIVQLPADDKVSIIVVHHDRPEYLNICIQSIATLSSNNNYELIVVDSGSTRPDALEYLKDLEESQNCKVVRKKENVYLPACFNAGVKAAAKDSRYYILMHEDTVILDPTWIDMLINISDGNKCGVVGLGLNPGYTIDGQRASFIEDWCMLVTRECWENCGPFEEELPILGAAFLFSVVTSVAGYSPQKITPNLVHHYNSFSIDINEFESAQYEVKEKLYRLMALARQKGEMVKKKRNI